MTDNPKKLPDFDCPNDLHGPYYSGELIRFMGKFRLRNPIMYYLWYRWWLLRTVPKEHRVAVAQCARERGGNFIRRWADFAMYHPVLFLIWLIGYSSFQLLVKMFTAPVKWTRALWR